MWNLVLYLVAVVVGLVLYYTYDENEENEECINQAASLSEAAVKPAVSDFRFSSLFAVLGFSVPGDTSEERFESFTEHFTTFDEVTADVVVMVMVMLYPLLSVYQSAYV